MEPLSGRGSEPLLSAGPGWRFIEKLPEGVDSELWHRGSEAQHTGHLYFLDRDLARAREFFEQAIDLFVRAGDEREAAVSTGSLGDVAFFQGRPQEAVDLYEQTCATARVLGDAYVEALSLMKAGSIYGLFGDDEIKRAYWQRAAGLSGEIAQVLGQDGSGNPLKVVGESTTGQRPEGEAAGTAQPPARSRRWRLGWARRRHLRAEAASPSEGLLAAADALGQSTSDPQIQLLACFMKGEEFRTRDNHVPAVEEFSKALEYAARLDHEMQDRTIRNLVIGAHLGRAESFLALGEPSKARRDAEAASRSLPQQVAGAGRTQVERVAAWDDERFVARTCDIVARVDLLLGRVEEAEATMRQGLDICLSWQGLPMPAQMKRQSAHATGRCALSLGILYADTGRPEQALEQLEFARSAFEVAEDISGQASCHLSIANALAEMLQRNADGATDVVSESTPVAADIDHHYETARDLFLRVDDARGAAQVAGAAGSYMLDAGWPAQAQVWLSEAFRLHKLTGNQRGLAMDLLNEGFVYRLLGLHERARKALAEAERLARDLELPQLEWEVEANLGALAEERRELHEARTHLQAATAIIESLRALLTTEGHKVRFFDGKEGVYQRLIRVCLSLQQHEPAFLAVERSRSRALLDLLRDTALQPGGEIDRRWLEQEADLVRRSRIATRALETGPDTLGDRRRALLDEVKTTRQSLESLLERMSSVVPEHVALRRGDPVDLEDVRRIVQGERRVVLVEYFTMLDAVLVFGIAPEFTGPDVVELPLSVSELRRFVRSNFGAHERVRELVADGLEDLWHGYDYLVEPVRRWARPGDVVYLIPHGLLHYLPLHALTLDSRYLIERNPVAYAPSASVLRFCQAKRKIGANGVSARPTAAVFGDSQQDLPHARGEAEKVAALFDVPPLLGDSIGRSAFQRSLANAGIVHFAGHGYFDADNPLDSGLRLAGDDVLTTRDVFDLPSSLNASLVTLSGCETGVSENHPGDELLGLTRAFLYAGAPSLLVSLWRVADDSTAFLMRSFYGRLRAAGGSEATVDALRNAMLETKSEHHSLDRWAPFTLVGDWR